MIGRWLPAPRGFCSRARFTTACSSPIRRRDDSDAYFCEEQGLGVTFRALPVKTNRNIGVVGWGPALLPPTRGPAIASGSMRSTPTWSASRKPISPSSPIARGGSRSFSRWPPFARTRAVPKLRPAAARRFRGRLGAAAPADRPGHADLPPAPQARGRYRLHISTAMLICSPSSAPWPTSTA